MKITLLALAIAAITTFSGYAGDRYTCQKCGTTSYGSPLTGSCSRGGFHDNIHIADGDRDSKYTCQKCGTTSYDSPLTGSCSRGGVHDNVKN